MAYTISNGILTAVIAAPGSYAGARFDWTGFITQVTLEEGNHTFCVPESLTPGRGSGGIGLCNEFGISQAIGYEEAEAGEWFPKLGVGLLQKQENAPYDFTAAYLVRPFETEVQHGVHFVKFTVQPAECRGHRIQLTKSISLEDDRLIIDYRLENMGSKPLHTEEYNHNFVGINGAAAGEGYELRMPGEARVVNPESAYTEGLLNVSGTRISWTAEPDRPFYCSLTGWKNSEPGMYWELIHKPSRAGIRECGNFIPQKMALWGERHVISPEVFADISILPRHSKGWRRSYQFFTF